MNAIDRIASTSQAFGRHCALALAIYAPLGCALAAQTSAVGISESAADPCARPAAGTLISQPADLRSRDGALHVSLTITSASAEENHTRYCYLDSQGHQAPTLRIASGRYALPEASEPHADQHGTGPAATRHDPCAGDAMSAAATNLHFHGLVLPPVCHQDETLRTLVQPGDTFEYRLRISPGQPPGLYWYHPHVHGFSEQHLFGGASGAIVVEGIDRVVPELKDLPERVLLCVTSGCRVLRRRRLATPRDRPSSCRSTTCRSVSDLRVRCWGSSRGARALARAQCLCGYLSLSIR